MVRAGVEFDGRQGCLAGLNCGPWLARWALGLAIFLGGFGGMRWALAKEVTLVAYNLQNYEVEGNERVKPKSVSAREAVVRGIVSLKPDLLGVCEVGSWEALCELRERLRVCGVDLPELEWVRGPDTERHLAFLSRYPIRERFSRERVPYELQGTPQLVRRGFLDVAVECSRRGKIRLVGAHLKSRLPAPLGQEEIRRWEGRLLREHVEGILRADPQGGLVVYGDFNDTRDQPVVRELIGPRGSTGALQEVVTEDDWGDRWTHYWRAGEVYSRIDFILLSRGGLAGLVRGSGRVGRESDWREASDHRPVSVRLRVPDD
jgi:endonuclease/exonuclease/phosphatase family metal-dependent hydrolase